MQGGQCRHGTLRRAVPALHWDFPMKITPLITSATGMIGQGVLHAARSGTGDGPCCHPGRAEAGVGSEGHRGNRAELREITRGRYAGRQSPARIHDATNRFGETPAEPRVPISSPRWQSRHLAQRVFARSRLCRGIVKSRLARQGRYAGSFRSLRPPAVELSFFGRAWPPVYGV
jgi:hypothetical protein